MKIAILGGTGSIGEGFALRWSVKHEISVCSREVDRAVKAAGEYTETLLSKGLVCCGITGCTNGAQSPVNRTVIDLHTHILPGIDDGAKSLELSLEMARIAVADGTTVMACTPHIYPGLYMNDGAGIRRARDKLQMALDLKQMPLRLVVGADAHLVPELRDGLKSGRVPTLHDSRYFLLEPSHHVQR